MGHVLHKDGPQLLIQRMESTCRNKAVLYPQPKMHLCFLTSLKPFLNIYDQNGWQCSFICWPVALSSFICLVGDTSPLSWLGLCEWGYPKQLRVSGAGGLQQTHREPLASTRTMPKVVSHVSSTRDLEINPGLSKGEGCAIAFFTAVRLPCLFIHITGRILVIYIYIYVKITRKPCAVQEHRGLCPLSALSCSSSHSLPSFQALSFSSTSRSPGASRWSCDISVATLGSTGAGDRQHWDGAAIPECGIASPPSGSLQSDASRPYPTWPWCQSVNELLSRCDFSKSWSCTSDAKCSDSHLS